jgi:hypothetical protein
LKRKQKKTRKFRQEEQDKEGNRFQSFETKLESCESNCSFEEDDLVRQSFGTGKFKEAQN